MNKKNNTNTKTNRELSETILIKEDYNNHRATLRFAFFSLILISLTVLTITLLNNDIEISGGCMIELDGEFNSRNYNVDNYSAIQMTFEDLRLNNIKLNDCSYKFKGSPLYLLAIFGGI